VRRHARVLPIVEEVVQITRTDIPGIPGCIVRCGRGAEAAWRYRAGALIDTIVRLYVRGEGPPRQLLSHGWAFSILLPVH